MKRRTNESDYPPFSRQSSRLWNFRVVEKEQQLVRFASHTCGSVAVEDPKVGTWARHFNFS